MKTTEDPSADLETEKNPSRTSDIFETDYNKIIIKPCETGEIHRTFINIPGLFIHGCSFKNLHRVGDLSDESKERLRQYGAESGKD